MKHLKIYSLITYHLILFGVIYCEVNVNGEDNENVRSIKPVGMTLNHPAQNGYHAVVLGTDKHNYGYEIKHQGKHFHHTNTEKDGVRLGCYGYEVEGKSYVTQYVADVKGYRLVTNEDLITVYPKSGRIGKAVFDENANFENDDAAKSSEVRYVFPKGCKGIDVQIDNSSRLRTIGTQRNFEISPRLPVTYPNRTDTDKYNHYKPSNSYPGPSHIYVPSNMISYPTPPSSFVRPPPPPANPANSYGRPPQVSSNNNNNRPIQAKPPVKPSNSYGRPPQVSSNNNNNRPIQVPSVPNNPTNTFISPTSKPSQNIQNTYLPPLSVIESTTPPASTYLPPQKPQSTYLPPESNTNKPIITTAQPIILGPSTPQNFYVGNLTELVPPKEEEKEEVTCSTQKECCEDSSGKLVIPIALKNRNSNDCCLNTAKLIVPLNKFDDASIEKLKEIFESQEVDAEKIIQNLLGNLL